MIEAVPNWNPHVTVSAIIERDGKFLMVEEISDGLRVVNQPSGHIENNENFATAIIRETYEETGWRFTPESLIGIYRWIHPDNNDTYLRHCFSGSCRQYNPRHELDDGILQALWLGYDEIKSKQEQLRSPLVLRCIEDYLAGQRFSLDLYHDVR